MGFELCRELGSHPLDNIDKFQGFAMISSSPFPMSRAFLGLMAKVLITSKELNMKKLFDRMFLAHGGLWAYVPMVVAALLPLGLASVESTIPGNMMARYECYAVAFWQGTGGINALPMRQCEFLPNIVQFHTLPIEYPPFSLAFFSLPLLIPFISYSLGFALSMALVMGVIYKALLQYGPDGSAQVFAIFMVISSFATAFSCYDIVPAGMTLVCLVLVVHRRWMMAYIVLGLAVLVKLYPILFFPIIFIAEQQDIQSYLNTSLKVLNTGSVGILHRIREIKSWHYKNSLIFLALLVGMTVFFGLFNFKDAVLSSLAYFLLRPIQVEAVGGVFLWLASLLGIPVTWQGSFGSLNVVSPIESVVSAISMIFLYVGYVSILIMSLQRKLNFNQAVLATLLVLIATSKVFSPQYLIWLVPVLAYCNSTSKAWWILWGSTSILTLIIFPFFYLFFGYFVMDLPNQPGFMQVILLRDGLIILTTLAYFFNWFNLRQPDINSGLVSE